MKKYTLFLFILSFILLGFLGLNNKTASAANCAPGDFFSTVTGQSCGTTIPTACKAGDLFSSLTGQPCSGTPPISYCVAQTNFQINYKGNDVKTLQIQLNAQGANLKVDGSYGPLTQAARLRYCPPPIPPATTIPIITSFTPTSSACGPTVFSDAASLVAAETKAGIKKGIAMGGFAFDGTNNIWMPITDLGGIGTNGFDSVMKITPSGNITTYTGTGIQPETIGFDGTNMWTANGYSSVTKITPSGAMTTYKGGGHPVAIAFDGTNMWVADSGILSGGSASPGSVIKITPSGTMTTYTIGADLHPGSIAFDGTNMWTANLGGFPDNGTGNVTKISPSGVVTAYSSGGAFSPVSIAFDGTNMWTANAMSGPASGVNSVTKITPLGAMITYPGGHTQGKSFHPSSIAFDGTNMWTGNGDSMTKITPSGAMTTYPLGRIGFGVTADNIATSNVGKIVFNGTNAWVGTGGGIDKINLSSACLPQSPALPAITNTSLPSGTFGSPYTVTLGSIVGAGLYRIWDVTGLPAGLSLNGVTSGGAIGGLQDTMYPGSGASPTISGTPSAVGTYNVTVTLTTTSNYVSGCYSDGSCSDPVYQTVSKQFILVIAPSSTYSTCGPTVAATYGGISNAPESSGAKGYDVNTYINSIAFDGTNMWTANTNWENQLEEQQHGLSINDSVTKITPSGVATIYMGTGINPVAIAFDGTNMWTANGDNATGIPSSGGSVTKITPSGTMTTYTGVGKYPVGIAFDGTNMWTANGQDSSVTKITPSGAMTTYTLPLTINGYKVQPATIAFDGTNMWTANYSSVTKITPSGAMTTYNNGIGVNAGLSGIAFDGTNMWAVGNNSVMKITPSGTVTTYAVTGYPARIAFDGTNMWTFNRDGSMTKITLSGTVMTYAGMIPPIDDEIGVAFDGTNMWVGQNLLTRINNSLNAVTKVNIVGTCSTPPPPSTTPATHTCTRCSMTNNYTRATFDSDLSDCNSTAAHNTNVVYSCDSSCGIAPGINGVGANTAYDDCTASSPSTGSVLGAKSFNFTQLLQEGSRGNEVMELQKFLNGAGYDAGNVDGIFGPKVKAALVKFQIANNLKSDGIMGSEVRTLLNK